ncbi:thymidine kinase [Kitasatospora sp. NPDC127116]|uniref:thymidine kinase n=1 Tax=Kitasatospora sp. NPDC127116 TaxID=3345367 RepID=UPI00363C3FE0
MPELVAHLGVMDAGKSTLALQLHHSLGGDGVMFTKGGRAGAGTISSRLGLQARAIEVTDRMDLYDLLMVLAEVTEPIPYVIADEAQFYTPKQINHLADAVDGLGVDVYAFGLRTDFRGELFPASKRLLELADRVEELPVKTLCWCGRKATHTARVKDGVMVHSGALVEVGDMGTYRSLCRRHHRAGIA